jgi:hypothetical protein
VTEFDEVAWWGDCANTFHEEQKQLVYAPRMGLRPDWGGAHPPRFYGGGRSFIDIGGGPCSLLLKHTNLGRAVVADPGGYPEWVVGRYDAHGIEYWQMPGESDSLRGYSFDEALIYNTLQHTVDPERVVANARSIARVVRVFEWLNLPPHPGHPHELSKPALDEWLGGHGFSALLDEHGAVGTAYYGVFRGTD